MKNKKNTTKKTIISIAAGSLAICMFLSPKAKANQYNINDSINTKELNAESKTLEFEEKAIKEIYGLRYYAKEKKDAYIKQIKGKTEQEINTLINEAKIEYLKEISEKAKSEYERLKTLLDEVKSYPELDRNNDDYRIQSLIWDNGKVAQDNINNYMELVKGTVDTSKIKNLEDYFDQFKYYIVHSQIEIMTRKVAIYRAKYPNNVEINKIFKEKLMQTNANYGTLDGIKLEEYFENEFKPYFLQIQENVKLEDLKVELSQLIQKAKDKKYTEIYNKKDTKRKNKFEKSISNAENILAKQNLNIQDIKDVENVFAELENAIKEIDKDTSGSSSNPMQESKLHDTKGLLKGTTNVRTSPNGPIIGTLTRGTIVEGKYKEGSNWVKFNYKGQEAYIYKSLLSNTIEVKGFAGGDVNIRKIPNGKITGVLKRGEIVKGVVSIDNPNWVKSDRGYIYGKLVVDTLKVKGLLSGVTNVRQTPNGKILRSLKKDSVVNGKISSNSPNWIEIQYKGQKAYVYRACVK